MVQAPIFLEHQSNLEEKDNPSILLKDYFSSETEPSIFSINSARVIRSIKENKLSFSSTEVST